MYLTLMFVTLMFAPNPNVGHVPNPNVCNPNGEERLHPPLYT
jgi:hypothetical protein